MISIGRSNDLLFITVTGKIDNMRILIMADARPIKHYIALVPFGASAQKYVYNHARRKSRGDLISSINEVNAIISDGIIMKTLPIYGWEIPMNNAIVSERVHTILNNSGYTLARTPIGNMEDKFWRLVSLSPHLVYSHEESERYIDQDIRDIKEFLESAGHEVIIQSEMTGHDARIRDFSELNDELSEHLEENSEMTTDEDQLFEYLGGLKSIWIMGMDGIRSVYYETHFNDWHCS